MTVENENKIPDSLSQEKIDASLSHNKSDANLDQNNVTPSIDTKSAESNPASEDPNWKAFREARKKDRAEREAAERRAAEKEAEVAALKAAMEAAFNKNSLPNSTNNTYQNNYNEETEDERIEKKVQMAIQMREAKADRERIEREKQEYPQRLVKNYPDFHHVISQDNLDYLDYHYPEVSRPLQRLQDDYDKWSDIYQSIKKFVPNNTSMKKESARAESNLSKPKSMSSPSMTESGQKSFSSLSAERKAANWERMQKSLKGVV